MVFRDNMVFRDRLSPAHNKKKNRNCHFDGQGVQRNWSKFTEVLLKTTIDNVIKLIGCRSLVNLLVSMS